jgi:hypothetical protein
MIHAKAQRRKEDEKVMAVPEPKTIEPPPAETMPALRDSGSAFIFLLGLRVHANARRLDAGWRHARLLAVDWR